MVFLEKFRFPTYDDEFNLLTDTEYDSPSVYPFGVLCEMSKRKSFEIEAYSGLIGFANKLFLSIWNSITL